MACYKFKQRYVGVSIVFGLITWFELERLHNSSRLRIGCVGGFCCDGDKK